jgi:hypothetical protein
MKNPTSTLGRLAALLLTAPAAAQPYRLWIDQLGSDGSDYGWAVAPDLGGGVFFAGFTTGSLAGPNAGYYDLVLARYDTAGNQVWLTQFGTEEDDRALALMPDGAGGFFVGGYTGGDLAGPSAGGLDAFFAHYDADGHQTSITQFGSKRDDGLSALAPDGEGGLFMSGWTEGDLGGPNAGEIDSFLAHFDDTGNQTWLSQFGTGASEYGGALAPDDVGGFFLAGELWNYSETFLARYKADGQRLWSADFGSSGYDSPKALIPDGAGGVIVAGQTYGDYGGPPMGKGDAYLARFDQTGKQHWVTKLATTGADDAFSLAPDGAGAFYACGLTAGDLGGPNAGAWDCYIARFTPEGEVLRVAQFGTPQQDWPNALASDGAGGVFVAGFTQGSLGGPNAGGDDAFLARFVPACYPDFTGDDALDFFDFLAFANAFNAGEPEADCTGDNTLDLFDFLCFVYAFNQGC